MEIPYPRRIIQESWNLAMYHFLQFEERCWRVKLKIQIRKLRSVPYGIFKKLSMEPWNMTRENLSWRNLEPGAQEFWLQLTSLLEVSMTNKFTWLSITIFPEKRKHTFTESDVPDVSVEKVFYFKLGVAINLVMPEDYNKIKAIE